MGSTEIVDWRTGGTPSQLNSVMGSLIYNSVVLQKNWKLDLNFKQLWFKKFRKLLFLLQRLNTYFKRQNIRSIYLRAFWIFHLRIKMIRILEALLLQLCVTNIFCIYPNINKWVELQHQYTSILTKEQKYYINTVLFSRFCRTLNLITFETFIQLNCTTVFYQHQVTFCATEPTLQWKRATHCMNTT